MENLTDLLTIQEALTETLRTAWELGVRAAAERKRLMGEGAKINDLLPKGQRWHVAVWADGTTIDYKPLWAFKAAE